MVMPKTVNCFPSWMVMPKTVNGITIQVEWLCRRQSTAQPSKLNGYAEDIQLCFPSWMVMPTEDSQMFSKLNVYAEDSQRHNHPSWMVMPRTVNCFPCQVEWLCRRQSTVFKGWMVTDIQLFSKLNRVMPKTVNGNRHNHPSSRHSTA
jgi:hypothetical protein